MPRVRLLLTTGVAAVMAGLIVAACESGPPKPTAAPALTSHQDLVKRGQYLAQIGVCQACHTPPRVPDKPPKPGDTGPIDQERNFRTDPDWVRYLDTTRPYAGGVPFIIRLSKDSSATVYTSNLTPDKKTGIGSWSTADIVKALRTGVKPNGEVLFLFPPHSFFNNLSDDDANAIADLIKSLPYTKHDTPKSPIRYGTDWRAAFKQVCGEEPAKHDEEIYGK